MQLQVFTQIGSASVAESEASGVTAQERSARIQIQQFAFFPPYQRMTEIEAHMSMRLRELQQVIETALKAAEAAGTTTPESRAMIIGAAIDALLSKRPKEIHHHYAPPRSPISSPQRFHPGLGPPKVRA